MIVALSGTPGTGKTSVSNLLKKEGYKIISLNEISIKKGFIEGIDEKRKSKIIDINKVNTYIQEEYKSENLVVIEGHASHFLNCVEKIIILRCKPRILKKRLKKKGWAKEKIHENIEAEILDIILSESVESHNEEDIFEINTSYKTIESVCKAIIEIIDNNFKPTKKYNIGKIDWSEEILKDYWNG